ncbi:MAG: cellulase family glycosylhydrolase [Bacteroidetes bacterium]|nr:cellulase family glycosylhydrolase [Bacteroidota bacterium]
MKRGILYILLSCLIHQTYSQTLATQRCTAFEKGMNLSNWLEAAWQPNWPTSNGYSKADLQKMKDAGIKSLRLPICFARVVDSIAPYFVDTNHVLFSRIDSVIQWANELQMNVIIDNHHEWSFTNERWRVNRERFAHLWAVVAAKYKYLDPNRYTFELLNEPPLFFALDSLNNVFNDAIDSIRQHSTSHTIIVTPNASSLGIAYNTNYTPLPDTNLIYTWHCYDPVDFTHQGFTWTNPVFPTGTPFPIIPTSFYESILYEGITRLNHWRDTFNRPVFLGEFGVGEFADDASRCNWMEYMGHQLDSTHTSWFYWDWRWDFSLFNSHVVSADSVIPCFAHALHLYGDTVFSSMKQEQSLVPFNANVYPTIICTGNSFHISVEGVSNFNCKIFDSTGRLVQQQNFTQSETNVSFPYECGIYFVQVMADNKMVVKKLVVD